MKCINAFLTVAILGVGGGVIAAIFIIPTPSWAVPVAIVGAVSCLIGLGLGIYESAKHFP